MLTYGQPGKTVPSTGQGECLYILSEREDFKRYARKQRSFTYLDGGVCGESKEFVQQKTQRIVK